MIKPVDLGLPAKFTEFRENQLELSAKICASTKYCYMVDAPTGTGKSLIGATVQRLMEKNVVYLCTTKQLQRQLLADFPYARTLMGRSNYPCLKFAKMYPHVTAEECSDKEMDPCDRKSSCPYMVAKKEALGAPLAVLNMSYFLTEANFVGTFSEQDFVIVDECLPYKALITLANGETEYIGKIVNQNMQVDVLSFNSVTGRVEPKPIIKWVRNPPSENTWQIIIDTKGYPKLRCTANHPLITPTGDRPAGHIAKGDVIFVKQALRTGCSPHISKEAEEIILGALLGDASISQNTSGSNRSFLTLTQKSDAYFNHVRGLLEPLFTAESCKGPNWYGDLVINKVASTSSAQLDVLRLMCRAGGKKEVTAEWLSRVHDAGLAIFYMDDGSMHRTAYSATLAVNGFSEESVQLISSWLYSNWGIESKYRNEKGYVIHIGQQQSKKLFSAIAKYVHPSMERKLPPEYRGKYVDLKIYWQELSEAVVFSSLSAPFPKECSKSTSEPYCYNIEVADNHNYFANNVLVHNCDTLEDQLMSFVDVTITQKQLDSLQLNPPKFKTKFESWVEWANEAVSVLKPRLASIQNEINGAWATTDFELMKEEKRLSRLMGKLNFFVKEVDKNWVWLPAPDHWSFKPVWVGKYAQNAFWKHTGKVLMMSATILDYMQICRNVGLDVMKVSYKALPSPFPKEHRPIYLDYAALVTNKTMLEALPKLAKKIRAIMDEHPDDKVLVHCVTYKLRDYLMQNLNSGRLMTHNSFDRESVLESYKMAKQPKVLLSPSMDRGVDLPGDQCRVVIIAKVPYGDLGDPQISKRVHASRDGNQWYAHKAVSKIIQMSGRAVRSKDDWAETFILDEKFEGLYAENRRMFPKWYTEAIIR